MPTCDQYLPMTRLLILLSILLWPAALHADDLHVASVERPPFATFAGTDPSGFSIELWQLVAKELGHRSTFTSHDSFADMLSALETGDADVAVANISITAQREEVLDFSHSIFDSGLQIMVHKQAETTSIWSILARRDLLLSIALAFLALAAGGMLMWAMERRAQPYFDRPAHEALFPSFWWALNLVVNGGFEERVPRSFFGRVFGVLLVISSLFIVSVFVAKITAIMTVSAIQGSINSVNDLYGKEVGTIEGSTSAGYLGRREIDYRGFADLDALIDGFEKGEVAAVVFDAPVLAYYANSTGHGTAEMAGNVFLRESYGFALPSGSPLLEPINQTLLRLREDGRYDRIYRKYFGAIN